MGIQRVTLTEVVDVFALDQKERDFVFSLIDALNDYEHKRALTSDVASQ